MKIKFKKTTFFTLFMAFLFAFVIIQAIGFPFGSGLYPLVIGSVSLVLTLWQLVLELRGGGETKQEDVIDVAVDESTRSREGYRRAVRFLLWFGGIYVGIWLIGFKIAIPVFVFLFMELEGRVKWPIAILLTVVLAVLIFGPFTNLLGIGWPAGLLENRIDLPSFLQGRG